MSRDRYACLLFSKSWAKRLKYKYNSLDRIAAAVFQLPSSARRVCAISCYLPDESVDDAVCIYEATLNRISELMLQVRLLPGQQGRSCIVDCFVMLDANIELPANMTMTKEGEEIQITGRGVSGRNAEWRRNYNQAEGTEEK